MTSDRFKFRVWNEEAKQYNLSEYFIIPDGDLIEEIGGEDVLDEGDVIEQCTGLKDKNGKLIYEGDILKTLDGSICFVIWSGTSFWLESPGSEAKDWEYNSFYEHCEVIGNIHENKEL